MNVSINKFNKWLLRHSTWVKVLCPVIMTFSVKFINYDVTSLRDTHPIRFHLLQDWIIPTMPGLLILSTLILAVVLYVEVREKPKVDALIQDLSDAKQRNSIISERVRDLFDGYLYNLANKLGFGTQNSNCERVTLYIHDQGNTFIQCGRYSANPKYRGVNRTSYPDGEGCISKGWQNSWHFDAGFPCPVANKSAYIDYCLEHYAVPRNTTRKINMKSRMYAVSCIGKNGTALAVIVVESESSARFNETAIKTILTEQNEFLSHTIEELRDYIPKPSTAKSVGL